MGSMEGILMHKWISATVVGIVASCVCSGSIAQQRLQPLPQEQLRSLAYAYGLVRSDSVKEQDPAGLIVAAIRGMVSRADAEDGEYYEPKEFEALKSSADHASFGLELRRRNGQVEIDPIAGSSAIEAGLRPKDVLHAVDGSRVRGLELHQIFDLLRGPDGSRASLTIFRESTLAVMTFQVERRTHAFQVAASELEPGVSILKIPHFNATSLEAIASQLRDRWERQPFTRGLVIDLRGCPGGLVSAALGLASVFLPEGAPIAQMEGRTAQSKVAYKAGPSAYLKGTATDPLASIPAAARRVPVSLLVDGGTSAGAEILVAALRDNHRASVVGRRTMGRASIQTIRQVSPDGDGVKFTTAYWISPSGIQIDGIGISPDIEVPDAYAPAALRSAVQALASGSR
jgi:carboxyl-terminal processing protease